MKNNSFYIFFIILFSCNFQSEKCDLIIHNATIFTVDENFSKAEAMAIKAGKIIAVGAEREILNKFSAKEKLDAEKKFIYPGFIDAHCHFLGYGKSLQQVNLVGTKSFEEVIERVNDFAKTFSEVWIQGRGWDQNDWTEKNFPDKKILDSLFPKTPVFLKRIDGHAALANSEVLKRININEKTKIEGGIIEIKNHQLTGILIDNAIDFAEKQIPDFTIEQKTKALLDAQKNCFAVGLTTVDDAGLNSSEIDLINELQKSGKLKIRIYAMLDGNNHDSLQKFLQLNPIKTERLSVRSFKFYADGALGSRGALLLEPYSDKENHYGLPINSEKYLRDAAEKINEKGFQMNTHCIGDSANRMMLNIYGGILKTTNDKRWRIEHAQVVHSDDLKKFSEYNIIPSVQPTHATSDMYWAEERLGKERIKNAYLYKNLYEQNKLIALGTDFPVENISPLKTFFAAVSRKDEKGFPENGFQMENALFKEEALKGMTIFAAIANFEETEKGSLEKGKFADFVIVDIDLLKTQSEEILKSKIIATFINGEKVYSSQ